MLKFNCQFLESLSWLVVDDKVYRIPFWQKLLYVTLLHYKIHYIKFYLDASMPSAFHTWKVLLLVHRFPITPGVAITSRKLSPSTSNL